MDDTSMRSAAPRLERLRTLARGLPPPLRSCARWGGGTAFRLYGRARRAAGRMAQVATPWRRTAAARARVSQVWAASPEERAKAQGVTWMSHPLVARRLSLKASDLPDADPYIHLKLRLAREGWSFPVPRVLSLGCGHGALERGLIAHIGVAESCDAIDLSEGAIREARRLAAEAGLSQIRYHVGDLERADFPEAAFDIVFAHQSMHHIEDLDGLCVAARRALRPGGVLHLDEFVGPDRFQWTDAQLRHMNAFVEALPSRHRRLASGDLRPPIRRPTIAEMLAADPSEAVRSSAILDAVRRHFRVVEVRELGGALLHMGLAGIAQNFDPQSPEDVVRLEAFFALEDRLMAEGEIGSDFVTVTAVRD